MLTLEGCSQIKVARQQMNYSDGRNGEMRLYSASTYTSSDDSETTSDEEGSANAITYRPGNPKSDPIPAQQRILRELKGVQSQGSSPASSNRLSSSHPLDHRRGHPSATNGCASIIVLMHGNDTCQRIACINRV